MTSHTKFANNMIRFRSLILNELTEVYGPALQRRQEKLTELLKQKTEQVKRSELAGKFRVAKGFYRLEMAPPSSQDEMRELQEDLNLVKEFIKTGCYKYITVKQAWLLFLVGLEVGLWFFLGETIGKMHIVGYKV